MRPSCRAAEERCLTRPGCRLEKKYFLIEKLEEKQYLIRPNCKANRRPGFLPEREALPV